MTFSPFDPPLTFSADLKQPRRLRWWLYGSLTIGIPIGLAPALQSGGGMGPLAVVLGVFLLVVLAFEGLVMRKLPKQGSPVFTLTTDAIESPYFLGDTKRFRWADIDSAEVSNANGAQMLQLRLRAQLGLPDRRDFIHGRNPSRPLAGLNALSTPNQEALLDAIASRLRPTGMALLDGLPTAARAEANPLREAREWQERLKALAPRTWVTWSLLGINVLVWMAMVALGASTLRGDPALLYAWGGNATSAVQAGEWWRLLTATFLHAGLIHLAFNMLGLYSIGALLERIYGHTQFLLIYLVSGLAGSVASLQFSAQTKVSVGASGAVFGIAGALIVGVYQHRHALPKHFSRPLISGMLPFLGYSLLMGLAQANIDNGAHVGGLVAGALVAWALPERFDLDRYQKLRLSRSALVVVGSALMLFWGVGQTAPAVVNVGEQVRAMKDFPALASEFDAAMLALRQEAEEVKAGRITQLQADEASRKIHAPRFAELVGRMETTVPYLPGRTGELGRELLNISRAFQETLAMESDIVNGQPLPANPARSAELARQTRASADRLAQLRAASTK